MSIYDAEHIDRRTKGPPLPGLGFNAAVTLVYRFPTRMTPYAHKRLEGRVRNAHMQ